MMCYGAGVDPGRKRGEGCACPPDLPELRGTGAAGLNNKCGAAWVPVQPKIDKFPHAFKKQLFFKTVISVTFAKPLTSFMMWTFSLTTEDMAWEKGR